MLMSGYDRPRASSRTIKSAPCVEGLRDLVVGGLGRVCGGTLLLGDRLERILQDVGALDVGHVRSVGSEPGVIGGLAGGLVRLRLDFVHAQTCRGVRDSALG